MPHYLTHLDCFKPARLPEEDFFRFLPILEDSHSPNIETAKCYLAACDDKLREVVLHPFSARDAHRLRARMIDRLVLSLYKSFIATNPALAGIPITLVAVGGYGRQEMSLYSDIDLLFLHDGRHLDAIKPTIEKILYFMWDLKLDVGYAVRTLSECRQLAHDDHTVFTNLLESRLLDGDEHLYASLESTIAQLLKNETVRHKFIENKLQELSERHGKFGGSVYLLEPNVKEGKGALRDLHLIRWLARAIGLKPSFSSLFEKQLINEEELKALNFSLRFFLQVRNRLHLLQKKKSDQILFDCQEKLALSMGFSDSQSGILAVEHFMQSYYTVASQVKQICHNTVLKIQSQEVRGLKLIINRMKAKNLDENFRTHEDQIQAKHDKVFEDDPFQLMMLFRHVQMTGLDIHFDTKDLVGKYLYLINDGFRSEPKITALFREMMSDLKNLGKALFAMHDLDVFDAFIPEFRKLRNRVQHDIYHVYTVDTHSIFAISELSKLATGHYAGKFDSYATALAEVKKSGILSMGLLFHDIGKGEGGNHSVVGAEITNRVATRLGYNQEERQTIEFLVLSHLMMPHLSQRRDLEDRHLIREFAKTAQDTDRLNMLYILTWGDIRAVSAESWTDWKGSLLNRLYEKTKLAFEESALSAENALKRGSDLRKAILSRMQNKIQPEKLESFLSGISPRYLVAHSDEEIDEHFHLLSAQDGANFIFQVKELPSAEVDQILIYTYSNPRVLALVTGVMLAYGINILDMEVFTLSQGFIFIKMRVQTESKMTIAQAQIQNKLEDNLRAVFTGKARVDDLIAKRKRPSYMTIKRPVQKAEIKVDIDNDVSPYFTIIDVYTHDRLGLLYDIIKCLTEQSCYVEVSKISTKVEQVVDSFYVKDIFGHKITSKNKLLEIKKALIKTLTPTPEASPAPATTQGFPL